MVPDAIQDGINAPMSIKIIMGIVAILHPWMTPSSILFHRVPVNISKMVAKAMENSKDK
jgi:hypothetical protein